MNYRLAIFDFDGTLADSFPFFLSVFNTIADRHGFRRIDFTDAGQLRHYGMRQMMDHVGLPAWKLPAAARTFKAMMRENAGSIYLFDGVAEALRHLDAQGVTIAVVSSNSGHNVRTVLGQELAALVSQFECGMSVFGKASRIRAVLKRCGAAPAEAIYIGDQGTDAEASRKAGVAFGAVHWGYAPIEALRVSGCDVEFATPVDLLQIKPQ
ncbi:haloacid dehalogenase [Massilia sp. WF1]|uniref:HAD hydrolase-like protein n=1 Tax=unclassified Massilia TaxID=2609279 RepID=UPI00064A4C40|nr:MULTISPECIES: HAD hydrolase-like protein [unclassified Massilia]ALK94914.1 haloacid dehalogenase [Massilia sp. WG5]KLU38332.1 haloacid dehalogenase [Massilia sp. WF1]